MNFLWGIFRQPRLSWVIIWWHHIDVDIDIHILMSRLKNFKQLNDVSYLRFNFTYMPKVDYKTDRQQPRPGLLAADCSLCWIHSPRQEAFVKLSGRSATACCQVALVICNSVLGLLPNTSSSSLNFCHLTLSAIVCNQKLKVWQYMAKNQIEIVSIFEKWRTT